LIDTYYHPEFLSQKPPQSNNHYRISSASEQEHDHSTKNRQLAGRPVAPAPSTKASRRGRELQELQDINEIVRSDSGDESNSDACLNKSSKVVRADGPAVPEREVYNRQVFDVGKTLQSLWLTDIQRKKCLCYALHKISLVVASSKRVSRCIDLQ
jgi:hypothetical protein